MAGDRGWRCRSRRRGSFIAALRPTDEVMVLAIGSEIETITPPVSAREAGATRWEAIDAWGTTPLYDAAVQALDAIQARSGRRALLLISDGIDRDSQTTATDLIARARESNVLVYPVAIGGTRPPVFAELANVTGGTDVLHRRSEAPRVAVGDLWRASCGFSICSAIRRSGPPAPTPGVARSIRGDGLAT